MASKLLNHKIVRSMKQGFRERRFRFFLQLVETLGNKKPLKILDIGGTQLFWERMNFLQHKNVHITLLNLKKFETRNENFTSVIGTATDLSQYKDKEFDIVFSNSVIEHLFTLENQKKMADEVGRVGRYYYVQTPNYHFPVEPHFMCPFFHYLPRETRIYLTRHFSLGNFPKAASREQAIDWVDERRLLSRKEMKRLFPDGKVYNEPFLGMTKSVTMYRFPSPEPGRSQ